MFEPLNAHPEIRPVPGHADYFASTDGQVYSTKSKGVLRELKPVYAGGANNDYAYVNLSRHVRIGVHQIVAMTFVPMPPELDGRKFVVRHKDGNPRNNAASNLEWGTYRDNLLDRRRHGTAPIGEKNHQSRITAGQAVEIRRRRAQGERCRDIAADMGIAYQTVHKIGAGKTWTHVDEAPAPRQRQPRKAVALVGPQSSNR